MSKCIAMLEIDSSKKIEMIEITEAVKDYIAQSEAVTGHLLVYSPHTTAGITVNENADPDVCNDIEKFLEKNYKSEDWFRHFEGNTPSHILSTLISPSQSFIINEGAIVLGRWQGIYFVECDGPRESRKIYLSIIN